ncbi:MAG: diacylglycerol kinase family protein [Hyphomicrobiaceae bacterium]
MSEREITAIELASGRFVPIAQGPIIVIVNAGAGAALSDPTGLSDSIGRMLTEAGREAQIRLVPPDELGAAVATAAASRPGLIIAAGGDGTARTTAAHLVGSDIALGVLPLGTVNRLANDLGMPQQLAAAIAAILDGERIRMDVGRLNGRIFLNNSLLGLPIEVLDARQRLRGRPWRERALGALAVAWRVMRHRNRFDAEIEGIAGRFRVRAMSIAISNNAYEERPHIPHLRSVLDGNELVLYVSTHDVGWKLVRSFVRSLAGRWSDDASVEVHRMPGLTLHSSRAKVRVTVDGEIETVDTPLVYAIEPKALSVVRARS